VQPAAFVAEGRADARADRCVESPLMRTSLAFAAAAILLVTSCASDDRATTVEAPDTVVTTSAVEPEPEPAEAAEILPTPEDLPAGWSPVTELDEERGGDSASDTCFDEAFAATGLYSEAVEFDESAASSAFS
jgi:hypothetical protein